MQPIFSVYIATSLDGFIARKDGALDWLPGADGTATDIPEGEDFGYAAFTAGVDCLLMGRGTFETAQSFGLWPYEGKKVVVMSHTLTAVPEGYEDKITLTNQSPTDLANSLYADGIRHVYLDGGKIIQSFLACGLVDDMIITQVPVLIGTGLPLFGRLPNDIKLQHDWTKSFKNGFLQSRYVIKR